MTKLEKLARHKHSSLLEIYVNYGQKSFIIMGPGVRFIKVFVHYWTSKLKRLSKLSLKLANKIKSLPLEWSS
jgi:hypothetical protein